MPVKDVIAIHKASMVKTVEHLQGELKGVRTGQASTGLVDNLRVEYYGSPTPMNQVATISAPDPTMIVIKPFDASAIKDIEKAIKTSDLSLAPIVDGKVVRLNIPPLSEERRKQIATQVKQMGEQSKISIRNIRRDAIKELEDQEKQKLISEDDRDKGKKDVESLTKDYVNKIDDIIKKKSDDIMKD